MADSSLIKEKFIFPEPEVRYVRVGEPKLPDPDIIVTISDDASFMTLHPASGVVPESIQKQIQQNWQCPLCKIIYSPL